MNNPDKASAAILRTEAVAKTYSDGQVNALVDVDLVIRDGDYVALSGPSGSGKSTLLNILGALDRPSSGEVYFRNEPLSAMGNLDRFRAQNLGFVFQSFHLLAILTAVENVQIPMFEGPLSAAARESKAKELLEMVGMNHRAKHLPKQMSVGERQRVAIARALANDPVLLLADEPTGNLDSTTAEGIFELFARLHRERHVTIVLVTHDDSFAARAQRRLKMRDGRIIADDGGFDAAREA